MLLGRHYDSCLSDGNQTGNSVTHLSKMTDLYTAAFPSSQITFTIQVGFTSPIWPWNEITIFLMCQYTLLLCCHLNATYNNNIHENLISSIVNQLRLTHNENFLKGAGGNTGKNLCNKSFNRYANSLHTLYSLQFKVILYIMSIVISLCHITLFYLQIKYCWRWSQKSGVQSFQNFSAISDVWVLRVFTPINLFWLVSQESKKKLCYEG